VYLQAQSTLEDDRAAALQAAEDLFGAGSTQAQAVLAGFNAVGLNGSFQPPVNSCGTVPQVPDLSLVGLLTVMLLIAVTAVLRGRRKTA
jgi:hypothetical protein